MFCPNCGNKLNINEQFCSECGTKIENNNLNTTADVISKKTSKMFSNITNSVKTFITKYQKQLIIVSSCCLVLIIGLTLYSNFYGFDKLTWNKDYNDFNLEYVTQTKLKLGVNFKNEKDIKFSSNCGEIEQNGLEAIWDLSDSTGSCKITASYKLKKISKEYKIINYNNSEKELALEKKIDINSHEDIDLDGLTNKQETEYKTDLELSDSDMDGLDDNYEINTSKTNPNKKDSDDDGLNDYDEIELGLDPLKKDSKDDGVEDGKRKQSYEYSNQNVKLSITGTGNIASVVGEVTTNTKISNKKGLIDNLYTFYTDGTIEEAIVKITYTDEELSKYGLNEDNLSIYYYNTENSEYEKIETTIDKENNLLTATLKHFSNYIIGDTNLVKTKATNQILFILDNSWSMYTNEQYKEITGEEYSGGWFGSSTLGGYDSSGLRFSLTSNLIASLSNKNFEIGLSEFRDDYKNALSIGSSEKSLKDKLKNMNGKFITNSAGTNISNALISGISEFKNDSDNKYIVILTDGEDSSLSSKTNKIIEQASSNNVKICSIGFGSGAYNTQLSNISNSTGCKFYSSSNSSGLKELFDNIDSELNDNLVDIDGDKKDDGILLADSGFVVNRDGFSFKNYVTYKDEKINNGHCHGMATFAQLYYKKLLPLNVEAKPNSNTYSYNLSNTHFKNYSNLYDFKLKTNILKYTFGYDMFNENPPADLMKLDGTKLAFNDKYKKEILNSEIYDIFEYETTSSSKEQIDSWGVNYETIEKKYLNENKMQTGNSLNNDDKQLLNAISLLFVKQGEGGFYSSGMSFDLWKMDVLGSIAGIDYIKDKGANGFINILKSRLSDKDAIVLSADFYGQHSINAINLIQDIDNPNYYYIGVYDNNYPGEKRYVDIECNKDTCSIVANDYYPKAKGPISITPSLEYDLEYFNK